MIFRRTPQFRSDFKNLIERHKLDVEEAFPFVSEALQGDSDLRSQFRIKKMQGHTSVWEGHIKINLCFTFHYETKSDGETVVVFRRIGSHDIYGNP